MRPMRLFRPIKSTTRGICATVSHAARTPMKVYNRGPVTSAWTKVRSTMNTK